ncbi:MAG: transporter [Ardenticatenaceae bacterium]|nr:transporter [Ardenticatenaceae bacterium]
MDQTIQIINRVLPILLLLSVGYWIRVKNFLIPATIEDLRKFVVNITLPAVLFISFLEIELKSAYFVIFGFTFLLCILLFFLGRLLKRQFNIQHEYFPYLTTGFEYGMLGISLFGSAYGLSQIGYIAVVDLGHEIFIWFVFLPLLLMKRDGKQSLAGIGRSFITSPVVIAIVASLILNVLGTAVTLYELPITGAVMSTFQFLGNLTIPLILVIVGYGIKFDRHGLQDSLQVVLIRLAILIPLALIVNRFVIRGLLQLDPFFEAAVFTLLILPPPFIVPLYARRDLQISEKQYINNVLMVHTVISIAVYIIYFALNPLV